MTIQGDIGSPISGRLVGLYGARLPLIVAGTMEAIATIGMTFPRAC